jgi:hypothetical protein
MKVPRRGKESTMLTVIGRAIDRLMRWFTEY